MGKLPVVYPNKAARGAPDAAAITLGWFVGAIFFILTFGLTRMVLLATLVGVFFGAAFAWFIYNTLTRKEQ